MSHHHRDHSAARHPSLLIGVRTNCLNGAQPRSTADVTDTNEEEPATLAGELGSKEHFMKFFLSKCIDNTVVCFLDAALVVALHFL